jgi:hypothetical protein
MRDLPRFWRTHARGCFTATLPARLSERVFEVWARSGAQSDPSVRSEVPKAIAVVGPAVGLILLVVLALLSAFAYAVLKLLVLF